MTACAVYNAFNPRDLADWQEFVDERAAIFEYLGGYPRSAAEAMAREIAGPPPKARPLSAARVQENSGG